MFGAGPLAAHFDGQHLDPVNPAQHHALDTTRSEDPSTSSLSPAASELSMAKDPRMVTIEVLQGDGDAALHFAALDSPSTSSTSSTSNSSSRRSWTQRLGDQLWFELQAFGAIVYSLFQPAPMGHHWVLFTPLMAAVLCMVFCMTVAYFPYSLVLRATNLCQQRNATAYAECVVRSVSTTSDGPAYMLGWLSGADDGQRAYDLTFAYMNGWGALYPPLVAEGQWWRLFTSQLLHWGMAHLAGNLVVLVALGVPLERRFGWWRVALAWMLAVLGGDLLSLYAENPCDQVLGASGGVFGLVGLFAADLVLNRHHLRMPIFHAGMALTFFLIFGVTVLTQQNISNYSHLGGVLCGLVPSLAFLPTVNTPRDTVQHVLRAVGALFAVLWFSIMPWAVWSRVLPDLSCPL